MRDVAIDLYSGKTLGSHLYHGEIGDFVIGVKISGGRCSLKLVLNHSRGRAVVVIRFSCLDICAVICGDFVMRLDKCDGIWKGIGKGIVGGKVWVDREDKHS